MKRSLFAMALLCLVIAFCPLRAEAAGGVPVDAANFPDAVFRSYVSENIDTDGSGVLSESEIESVTEIILTEKGIEKLDGVENFTELKKLSCAQNQLGTLDLSSNKKLEYLNCWGNKLTELKLPDRHTLTELHCSGNLLTKLDVSRTALKKLTASGNPLDEMEDGLDLHDFGDLYYLNLEDCTGLSSLNCSGCPLVTLIVDGCSSLKTLLCTGSHLTNLTLKRCGSIETLYCIGSRLSRLDVSGHSSLRLLYAANNGLLKELYCGGCSLNTLNVRLCPELEILDCHGNALSALDVLGCPKLYKAYVNGNDLAELNISKCPLLADAFENGSSSQADGAVTYTSGENVLKVDGDTDVYTEVTVPVIKRHPATAVRSPGESATFRVTASGHGLSYRWQVMNSNGSSWVDLTGEGWNTDSYTISDVSEEAHNSLFRCIVSNSAGSVTSKSAYLIVVVPPPLPPDYMLGDVDLSGAVDAQDLTALARHVARISVLEEPMQMTNADVTGDGMVGADDLTKLARYIARIIDTLAFDWEGEI